MLSLLHRHPPLYQHPAWLGTVLLAAASKTLPALGWLQVGPELEIPGYGCEDHFMEHDTVEHSWVGGFKSRQRGWATGKLGWCGVASLLLLASLSPPLRLSRCRSVWRS